MSSIHDLYSTVVARIGTQGEVDGDVERLAIIASILSTRTNKVHASKVKALFGDDWNSYGECLTSFGISDAERKRMDFLSRYDA